ncbi:unnamed protein product [Anisakis simplex]|uniref:BPTI/Kunitz inhibitor domain-containing protein n=1 Tax=Anisakis simplex TaxID=6269 RepID=A0A3P6NBP4_ANISI|nr:unnamed protein product [Anisakis simplex]
MGISEPSVSPSRAGPTFGDVKSNAISEGHSAASKEAAALEPSRAPVRANLDDTEVAKLDIGQQFSLQFATTLAVAVECLDQFDVNLTQSCGYGEWQSRYYFNRDTRKCQMYWNDGCRSLSRNNFENLAICEWKCEGTHPKPQSSEQKMLKIVNSNPTDINNLVVVSPNNRQETKFTVLLQSMHNFTIDL